MPLKLILVDPIEELCSQWRVQFSGLQNVEIVHGYFEEVSDFDCMVSPANSFGLMDGGVDRAITKYFGLELMDRVQQKIINNFCGEQPVGTSFIIETNHPKHPFLAHSPTMRMPMKIARTDNVYNAMWATLLAIQHHNTNSFKKINALLCPGLGTMTGQMPYIRAAKQMSLAYRNFISPPTEINWIYATKRQKSIRYGGDIQ
ncbi:macro domain-containing protein [Candidatus Uabimicrobium sp. HlEnr_7]|uniref:macro domain-containing protein n=1 Tax=Candidatus Uabimicrobium helgolandensis TaxID=3095367 RepID=UPI0035562EFD